MLKTRPGLIPFDIRFSYRSASRPVGELLRDLNAAVDFPTIFGRTCASERGRSIRGPCVCVTATVARDPGDIKFLHGFGVNFRGVSRVSTGAGRAGNTLPIVFAGPV